MFVIKQINQYFTVPDTNCYDGKHENKGFEIVIAKEQPSIFEYKDKKLRLT